MQYLLLRIDTQDPDVTAGYVTLSDAYRARLRARRELFDTVYALAGDIHCLTFWDALNVIDGDGELDDAYALRDDRPAGDLVETERDACSVYADGVEWTCHREDDSDATYVTYRAPWAALLGG
jgi:hypothetical protein